jgi:hypothetical protein
VDAKNHASIRSGPSFFKIIGLGEAEFPPLPDFAGAKEFKIPQIVLRDGLKKTSYAISTDETRYVLNGIFTSFRDGKLTLVATDGRRLAMVDADLDFPASHETDVIIPAKAVQELQRLLGDAGDVIVKLSDSQISFTVGDNRLCSKLIEGNYPNYRQVIPGDGNERVVIPREALLDTVRRVSLLSSEKSNSVKFVFSENRIEITANSPDVGEAQEWMDVMPDCGDRLRPRSTPCASPDTTGAPPPPPIAPVATAPARGPPAAPPCARMPQPTPSRIPVRAATGNSQTTPATPEIPLVPAPEVPETRPNPFSNTSVSCVSWSHSSHPS